jgi:hypothetical protein
VGINAEYNKVPNADFFFFFFFLKSFRNMHYTSRTSRTGTANVFINP